MARESNTQFAAKVGCNHTMASRLRSGQRMPSPSMLLAICKAYEVDEGEALRKYGEGAESFSAWLRVVVFGESESESGGSSD